MNASVDQPQLSAPPELDAMPCQASVLRPMQADQAPHVVDDMDIIVRNSVDRDSRMHDAQQRFYRDFHSDLKSGVYDRRSNGLDPRNERQQQRVKRSTPREAMGDGVGGVPDMVTLR